MRSLGDLKELFESSLSKSLKRPQQNDWSSKRLFDSMNYALLSPGKRLRPLLVLVSALSVNRSRPINQVLRLAMPSALAIEYVHTYSLIHDDLPAMDNDDYRRGRLSVHRQFDEALAILAGDALLADAFLLALSSPNNATQISRELAQASGSSALVAGQAEDLNKDSAQNFSRLLSINNAKTARLFAASAVMGGLSQSAAKDELLLLRTYGQAFGTAFQLKDDLDDDQGVSLLATRTEIADLKDQVVKQSFLNARKLSNPELLVALLLMAF